MELYRGCVGIFGGIVVGIQDFGLCCPHTGNQRTLMEMTRKPLFRLLGLGSRRRISPD